MLAAQFVQTAKSDRKNQDAPISEDVPVAANAKRARRREKSPVTAAPRAEPPVRRSPQKQRASLVQGEEHPRISGQPPAGKSRSSRTCELRWRDPARPTRGRRGVLRRRAAVETWHAVAVAVALGSDAVSSGDPARL